MDTRLMRTFSMASSVPVLACCRRSDSRAREKNSGRNKNEGRLILPVPPYPPPPRFCGDFYFKLRYCGFTKPNGLRYFIEIFG